MIGKLIQAFLVSFAVAAAAGLFLVPYLRKIKMSEQIREGLRPSLVIGVPVGFVNVCESKEALMEVCAETGVPAIAAMGRKGGSNVAAAIVNALLYTAADMLDPAKRGWTDKRTS